MKTIKAEGFIFLNAEFDSRWESSPYKWFSGTGEPFGRYIPVTPHTLAFEVPDDFDPRADQIKALERQRTELQAKCEAALTEIAARISKLQAIEWDRSEDNPALYPSEVEA
jgi:hypothetical protein